MKTYTYKGKDKSAVKSIALIPDGIYKLPDDDAQVKSFVARKILIPFEEKEVKKGTKDKKTPKKQK